MMAKRVGFFGALKLFYKNYVDFTGRSTRAEYWWLQLWKFLYGVIIYGIFVGIFLMYIKNTQGQGNMIVALVLLLLVGLIIALGSIVPSISLLVRRYRDAGVNPVLVIVPYVVPNAAFMLLGMPTSLGAKADFASDGFQFGIYALICVIVGIFNLVVTVLPSTDKRRFL